MRWKIRNHYLEAGVNLVVFESKLIQLSVRAQCTTIFHQIGRVRLFLFLCTQVILMHTYEIIATIVSQSSNTEVLYAEMMKF